MTFWADNQINIKIPPEKENDFSANILFLRFFPIFFLGFSAAIIKEDYLTQEHNKILNNYKWFLNFTRSKLFKRFISILIFFSHILFLILMGLIINLTMFGKKIKIPIENVSIYFSIAYSLMIIDIVLNKDIIVEKIIANKILKFLGNISYPGYLFNILIREYFVKLLKWSNIEYRLMIFASIFLMFFCFLMHKTIEIYFITLSKNLFKKKKNLITIIKNVPKNQSFSNDKSIINPDIYIEIKDLSVINEL